MAESTSSRSSWAAERAAMGPPMPYREGALSYEPTVFCRCRLKSLRRISWSDGNPGRRFFRCRRCRTPSDYGFFSWIDDEYPQFLKDLLLDLRNAVWSLKDIEWMQQAVSKEIEALKENNHQLEVEDLCKAEELKAI
ncbi:hypothetical protein U9M48_030317 [Paspalum notatum var. saurae]|uniref:GRF-type domain-containing protein n=1 Tax=Paspalum notatum var. saurae TaxID=547442 RepID=A0AAQ3TZW7_PASNO